MNFLRLPALLAMSEKAVRVGPGSVKDQPCKKTSSAEFIYYLRSLSDTYADGDPRLQALSLALETSEAVVQRT